MQCGPELHIISALKQGLKLMCDIKVKKTKNFIVFMEKNLTRDGVQFKCTISVKPTRKGSFAPRRVDSACKRIQRLQSITEKHAPKQI